MLSEMLLQGILNRNDTPRYLALAGRGVEDPVQDLSELNELAGIQELIEDAAMSLSPEPGCPVAIRQESRHNPSKLLVIRRVDKEPRSTVLDLILDAPHAARDDGGALPHGFGHREPEPFGQALLHHEVGPTLQRVHDCAVLLEVLHGQARPLDPF